MRHAVDSTLERFAGEVGSDGAVAVEGGRTRWNLGRRFPEPEVRLVRAPVGIVDHQPAEMTVRVRTGTPVAELVDVLAAQRQRCALHERGHGPSGSATVGGAIAVGENHPHLLGRGRLRDDVLEVRYVSAEGRVIIGGGPTVKNVTGFDLPRLLTGSMGTLGLLGEVVLRTNPIPQVSLWVRADDVDPRRIRHAVLRPGAMAWNGTTAWVLLEGHGPDVEADLATLRRLGDFTETDDGPALPANRWSVTPAEQYDTADRQDDTAEATVAFLGTGLSFCDRPQPRRAAPSAGSLAVTRRLVDLFDPTRRLNPGVDVPGLEGAD